MTEIANPAHAARWRQQALRIAEELKAIPEWKGRDKLKVGIAFDDAVVTVHLNISVILSSSVEDLAEALYAEALRAVADKQAEGPADAALAAPTEVQPQMALGQCWRRIEPDYVEQCTAEATGGIRLVLYPAETIQKRYGRRPMLQLLLDLPICPACFNKMTPAQVIADGLEPGQWGDISKIAQRKNNGWLPIKEQSVIEHVPAADPEYVGLRAHIAKHHPPAANDSQPGPAAPTT